MSVSDPRQFKGLSPIQVPLNSGLYETPSIVDTPFGSMAQSRNFEVVDGAYEESQGLTLVGPTLNDGLIDFWHADLPLADVAFAGTWNKGDDLYWYAEDGVTVAGSARLYYASLDGDGCYITIDRVSGVSPRRATSFYTSSGATLEVSGTTAAGDVFVYATDLGLTWSEYIGPKFLGSMVTEQAVEQATWDAFKPDPLGVSGISGLFQLNDSAYAVRDFFGGRFVDGVEEPSIGDLLTVGTFTAYVARVVVDSGTWEEGTAAGTIHLYPTESTTLDMADVSEWDASATITNSTTGNTAATTVASGTKTYKNKGLLWKLDKDQRQGGWKYIDLGYSVEFRGGEVAPIASLAPLITTEALPTITDTGFSNLLSPATEYPTTGSYTAWSNLGNLDDTTAATYATNTITAGVKSRVLVLPTLSDTIPGKARILGIEVQITAGQGAGTDVQISRVQLRNNASGATKYLSANRGENETLDTTLSTTYTYGGQLDTWGFDDISQEDINDGSFDVLIQFNNPGASARTVSVDLVQIKIHYAAEKQRVYFYDGATDIDSGDLYAYQVFDGDWSTDDAQGWMTFYDLGSPSAIPAGTQIRSAAAGGGSLLGIVRGVEKNLLPSLEEMDAQNAIYQSRAATFSGNEDSGAVYVTTAACPAFSLDKDDKFSFIRLPIDRDKDKPRYVEIHRNHLVLAVGSHLMISSVGAPNNFSTYDGATSWSLKDRVTGLASAPNGTTMIVCEDSIHTLQGSAASGQDGFAVRVFTDNSGARDYTITSLLGNVFVDYAGITTADVSDKYGGFDIGRKSGHVRPLLQNLLGTRTAAAAANNNVIGAIPVRKKNQYRIYFSDGEILTATFPESPDQPIAFTMQNYTAYYEGDARGYEATFTPTALSSAVLSTGDERLLLGTRLGHVMRIDPNYMEILSYANRNTALSERGEALRKWKQFKFFDLNHLHHEDPSQLVDYKTAEVYIEHGGYTKVARLATTDYKRISKIPTITTEVDTVGDYTSVGDSVNYPGTTVNDYFTWYIHESTDGLGIRFAKFGGQGAVPLRISKVFLRCSPKGYGKDRIDETRAYDVNPSVVPEDVIMTGDVIEATLTMGTPSINLTTNVDGAIIEMTASLTTPSMYFGVPIWTFDQVDFTFDNNTDHTFDGAIT